jgi:hypothetical protein
LGASLLGTRLYALSQLILTKTLWGNRQREIKQLVPVILRKEARQDDQEIQFEGLFTT